MGFVECIHSHPPPNLPLADWTEARGAAHGGADRTFEGGGAIIETASSVVRHSVWNLTADWHG